MHKTLDAFGRGDLVVECQALELEVQGLNAMTTV